MSFVWFILGFILGASGCVIVLYFIDKYQHDKNFVMTTETLLDAKTNKEKAKINSYKDTSEQSVKESVINGIVKGINNEVEKGNTRYYIDHYTNDQINKYFERKEIRKIFENAGYIVYFKYYLIDDISIAYISWR